MQHQWRSKDCEKKMYVRLQRMYLLSREICGTAYYYNCIIHYVLLSLACCMMGRCIIYIGFIRVEFYSLSRDMSQTETCRVIQMTRDVNKSSYVWLCAWMHRALSDYFIAK